MTGGPQLLDGLDVSLSTSEVTPCDLQEYANSSMPALILHILVEFVQNRWKIWSPEMTTCSEARQGGFWMFFRPIRV